MLLRLAFKRAGILQPLVIVHDGQAAIDYLSGEAPYADRLTHPLPVLILVDLKMPRLSGFDVLAWCASRPEFRTLPVVMLSSSPHETDMDKALTMGAREYVVKPHGFMQLTKLIGDVAQRWLPGVLAAD